MELSESADHESIRDGIRRICADFPDEFWSAKDEAHEFPWDFYAKHGQRVFVSRCVGEEGKGFT